MWSRFKKTCRDVPVHDNFYISWILRGSRGYDPLTRPDFAPPYLTRGGFRKLKVSVNDLKFSLIGHSDKHDPFCPHYRATLIRLSRLRIYLLHGMSHSCSISLI